RWNGSFQDSHHAQHGLVTVQPAVFAEGALARAAGDVARLVRPRQVVADQLQHLVAAAVAKDLLADDEVAGQVGVVRGQVHTAAGAGHFEVAPFHVGQFFGVFDATHAEVNDTAVENFDHV